MDADILRLHCCGNCGSVVDYILYHDWNGRWVCDVCWRYKNDPKRQDDLAQDQRDRTPKPGLGN